MVKMYKPAETDNVARIPLAGQYSNRSPSTTGGYAASGIVGLGVIGTMIIGGTGTAGSTKDQRFINCVFEKISNPYTKKEKFHVVKRPGFAFYNSGTALKSGHKGNAVHVWSSKTTGETPVWAFGNTNSEIFEGSTSLGSISGLVVDITETLIGTTAYLLFSSTDSTGWYYVDGAKDQTAYTGDTHTNTTIDGIASTVGMYVGQAITGTGIVAGTRIATVVGANSITVDTATTGTATVAITKEPLAKIIDADFPGNASLTTVGAFVCMNGFTYIMDSVGKVWNSDINSVTSWTTTGVIVSQMYPDKGIGLSRYKNQIVAFGRDTTEFFSDVGNPSGSPLQSTQQAFLKIGCVSATSILQFNDSLYWTSNSERGDITIYRLEGFNPVPVSTPAIEKILQVSTVTTLCLSGANMLGKAVLVATGNLATFVLDVEDGFWSEWSSSGQPWSRMSSTTSGTSVTYGISLQATDTSGKGYLMNQASLVYQDGGSNFTWMIQTSKVDFDTTDFKFLSKLTLVGDISSSSTVSVQWSDDDYATFNTARTMTLTTDTPYLRNCGKFKRRAFKFTNSDAYPIRFEAMELELKGGIH